MLVFFIVLAILFFISVFFLILCLSNLEIEIEDLDFDTTNQKHRKLEHYLLYIRLKLFDKITWFSFKIDREKVEKMKNSKITKSKLFKKINKFRNVKDILLKNKKKLLKKENINYIKRLKINIKELNLYVELCTINSILTSGIVAGIASIISIILARNIEKYNRDKYRYIITPIYEYNPLIKIKLNCIINIKMVHIINIIYILVKKRSVEYDERTSDRRTYVCSND